MSSDSVNADESTDKSVLEPTATETGLLPFLPRVKPRSKLTFMRCTEKDTAMEDSEGGLLTAAAEETDADASADMSLSDDGLPPVPTAARAKPAGTSSKRKRPAASSKKSASPAPAKEAKRKKKSDTPNTTSTLHGTKVKSQRMEVRSSILSQCSMSWLTAMQSGHAKDADFENGQRRRLQAIPFLQG